MESGGDGILTGAVSREVVEGDGQVAIVFAAVAGVLDLDTE
jgi:hypothetical protein